MAAVLEKQAKRWTYEQYYRLDDDQRYEIIDGNLLMAPDPTLVPRIRCGSHKKVAVEIIDGNLLMAPAPDTWHQSWIGELYTILRNHVRRRNLGKVFLS